LRGKFWLAVALAISTPFLLSSCNQIINYPAPRIKALNPPTIQAGASLFSLTVTGFQLTPASTVTWNGSPLITYFQTVNELTAQVPASLVANPGSVAIQVFTPQPGGGRSASVIFTITPPPTPVPRITSISPTSVLAGSGNFELFITGTDFVGSSTVTINGDDRAATVLNPTSIQLQIGAADVASAGTLQIAVVNPIGPPDEPGGGTSSPVSLVITNPVPTLSSLSPATFAAGITANTALQVNGSSFVPNSVIEIDGSPITTVFGSSSQLGATLTAGDFAAAGVRRVQVVNPSPGGGASNVLTYAVDPTLTHGLPVLLDYAYDGSQANQGICGPNCAAGPPTLTTAGPSINSDGSVAVYASTSTNLIKNQANTGSDIFSRTTCVASASCSPTTTDVSVGPNKSVSNGSSSEPSVDSGASHVAFTSTASNLVAGVSLAPGSRQVYWMPICTTTTTTSCSAGQLVSLSPDGVTPGDGDSYNPSISPDGRYVAFVSLATNLVSGLATLDGRTPQVFLRDTCNGVTSGCTPATYLISTPDGTTPGDGASSLPSVSSNGQYVSFTSASTNLGPTAPNPGGAQEIFERITCLPTVTTCAAITNLVSTPDGVTPANGSSSESKVASGGRFIVFASTATNLQTGAGPVQQVYMYDTCLSASTGCVPGPNLISTPDGSSPGNGTSEYPTISLGSSTTTTSSTAGEFVAFASRASNLGANTANGVENVFVRKMCVGFSSNTTSCTAVTALASQSAGTSPPPANGDSLIPAISGNAHTVAFISSANNLVANDTNGFANLFLALTSF
jgi:trimeric autotransporter adhesin